MTSITALVVEDVDLVRMVAVEALSDAGIHVTEAVDADAALAILNAQANGVNVLVTDISMPGTMDGLALARHTIQHWAWIGILILSARPPNRALMPPNSRFLAKPYSLIALTELVRIVAAK